MACLADSAGKDVRAATYRLVRHLLVDASDAIRLNEHHLPLFLVRCVPLSPIVASSTQALTRFVSSRSLSRNAQHDHEKTQALRLIRALITLAGPSLGHGREVVPVSVLRGVVALAETPEERLRVAALETLGELGEPLAPLSPSPSRRATT